MGCLSDGHADEQLKKFWRQGLSYKEIKQRLSDNVDEAAIQRRCHRIGLHENRNATDRQIAEVAAKRIKVDRERDQRRRDQRPKA